MVFPPSPLVTFFLTHRALTCHSWPCLGSMHGLALWWPSHLFPAVPAPHRACPLLHQIAGCLGLKCLGFCSGGFLSPASRLDAGSALGHGRYSTHNRQRSPSLVRVNAWGSTPLISAVLTCTTVPANRRSWDTGALNIADHTSPLSSRNGPNKAHPRSPPLAPRHP